MLTNIPDVLSIKELRSVLHISRSTALKLIHEGMLEAHMIGGKWLVLKEDVEELLKRG